MYIKLYNIYIIYIYIQLFLLWFGQKFRYKETLAVLRNSTKPRDAQRCCQAVDPLVGEVGSNSGTPTSPAPTSSSCNCPPLRWQSSCWWVPFVSWNLSSQFTPEILKYSTRHYWHNLGFSFKSVLRDHEVQFNRSSAVLQSKHFSGLSGCANSNGHRVGQAYHELQLCKARHMMKIVPLTLKVAACKKTQARLGHKESQEYRVNYVCSSWLQSMSKTCMFLPHRFCCFFFRPLSLSPWWPLPCSECLAVHRSELPGTSDQIAHPAAPITGMNR